MKILKNRDIILEGVRIIYCALAEKDTTEYGRDRFHLTVIEPKDSPQIANLKMEIQKIIVDKKLNIKERKYYPVKSGDDKYREKIDIISMDMELDNEKKAEKISRLDFYKDMSLIRMSSKLQPRILDKANKPLDPANLAFEGALVNVHLALWPYTKPGHGVACILKNIQLLEEGQMSSFGDIQAEDAFEVYPDENTPIDGFKDAL